MTDTLNVVRDRDVIPDPPICRSGTDETKPCEYAGHCNELRQRIQSGYEKRDGRWARIGQEMWGPACWAFVGFRVRGMSKSTKPAAPAPEREPGEEPF